MAKSKNDGAKDDVITIDVQPFLVPISLILSSIILSIAIVVASNNIGGVSSTSSDTTLGAADTTETAPAPAGEEFPEATTTIDDDPIQGDKDKAKVAIVEFSDYECPFCKRHFEQTYDQIIENFVDTGDAILVYRDFPLSFHDPLATNQAIAAECVQKLSNDKTYFEYHDLIFQTTNSNGQGMAEDKLYDLADEVGVDSGKFEDCYDDKEFADEVAADIAAGQDAGVSGTPGFVVGVLNDDGTVEGKRIDGAYPYASFEEIVNEMLEKAN